MNGVFFFFEESFSRTGRKRNLDDHKHILIDFDFKIFFSSSWNQWPMPHSVMVALLDCNLESKHLWDAKRWYPVTEAVQELLKSTFDSRLTRIYFEKDPTFFYSNLSFCTLTPTRMNQRNFFSKADIH